MGQARLDEEDLFHAARKIEPRHARAAHLDRACGGDRALRERLDALLGALDRGRDFLESPARPDDPGAATTGAGGAGRAGDSIGPYKLLEAIGEGGMGEVFMAEQTAPVRRKVALKIIKPGMDSRQVIARFEAERQALAMMDHPNIARVLDAGATETGVPYFVMELVRGIPITEYCDRERLPVRARLELFVLVCRAIQHAHQKGIIHRDIKPSNVLITLHDGVPVPTVIDFGIAKATGPSLTDKTLYTGFAQLVGTPLYMSPEQAEISGLDIDTRSDVYSLGVLLYELLTGTTPFDSETLRKAAFDEMRRIIREEDPVKPSTRLSSMGETLSTVSAKRGADPRRLNRAVRGELDWVVMRAMEKDRRRRYETANDFASDVMRYLSDQTVEACPPSARYRFGKFARRNRIALTTSALVALVLVAGAAASLWQASRATAAERRTASALRQSEGNLLLGRQAVDALYEEAALRWKSDPHQNPLPRSFLEKALPFYQEFADRDRVDRSVGLAHVRVGELLVQLGRQDEGRVEFGRGEAVLAALLAADPEDAERQYDLACCYGSQHNVGPARSPDLKAIALWEGLVTRFPGDIRYRKGLAIRHLALGGSYTWQRHPDAEMHNTRARGLFERLCAEAPGDIDLRWLMGVTLRCSGDVHKGAGRPAEAEPYFRRALALHDEMLARMPTRPQLWIQVGWDCTALGQALALQGRDDEARPSFARAATIFGGLSTDYPEVASYRSNQVDVLRDLAVACLKLGRRDEAERAIETISATKDRRDAAKGLGEIAREFVRGDVPRVVEPTYAAELAGRALVLDPESAFCWNVVGMARYRAGRWDDSIAALTKANELEQGKGLASHGFFLAMDYHHKGDAKQARSWYDRSVVWLAVNKVADLNLARYRDEAASLLGLKTPEAEAKPRADR